MTDLRHPSKLVRAPIARGLAEAGPPEGGNTPATRPDKPKPLPPVDRNAGDNGAGIIRGMAVLTRGEAIGHDLFVDRTMLEQAVTAINASEKGIKTRFTHPDISGDGLGKYTGRAKNASLDRDGQTVRADLHFSESAHDTPDGDLAGYLLTLAAEDPEAFGNSIAFEPDPQAELDFMFDNGARSTPEGGHDFSEWQSPDDDNERNLPHARIGALRAIDAVDDPAANPSGLFHQTTIADRADKAAAYALGLSAEVPPSLAFDAHPERIRSFVARFLNRHKLRVTRKGIPIMTTQDLDRDLQALFANVKPSQHLGRKLDDGPEGKKQDRKDQIKQAANDIGDADKEEGKDKGAETGRGADYAAAADCEKMEIEDGHINDNEKEKTTPLSADDPAADPPNKKYVEEDDDTRKDLADEEDDEKKKELAEEDDDPDSKQDADEAMRKMKRRRLAVGGEAPETSSTADETARQKQYQEDEEKKRKKGKPDAEKDTTVGSPGTEKGAIGPLGDPSHNVGYSQARADMNRFSAAFGEIGLKWFAEGLTWAEAQARFNKRTREKLEALEKENHDLKTKLQTRRGLETPLSGGESPPDQRKSATQARPNGMDKFRTGLGEQLARKNLN